MRLEICLCGLSNWQLRTIRCPSTIWSAGVQELVPNALGVQVSRPIADYVAMAMIGRVGDPDDFVSMVTPVEFQGSWQELRAEAEKRCGFELSDDTIRQAVRTLAKCGLARVSEDKYAGEFVKTYPDRFDAFVTKAEKEIEKATQEDDELGIVTRPSDYPNAAALNQHSVVGDYSELGDEWLRRALAGLRAQVAEAGSLSDLLVSNAQEIAPASDRVVYFSDNEIQEFGHKTTEIIESVEKLNSVADKPELRALILGQLRAGRELIKSGYFKAYLLEITLVDALRNLVRKYEHEAVGALAAALVAALLKHLGLDA